MEPLSLTVGSLTILEKCFTHGQRLVKLYNDYRQAKHEVSEALLKLKVVWLQTEIQMKVLRDIWQTLPPDHQQTQLSLLCVLETKLHKACRLLDEIIGSPSDTDELNVVAAKKGLLGKIKYAAIKKKDLDKGVKEFIEWHGLCDGAWRLLARVPSNKIDQCLQSQPNSKDAAIRVLIGLRKSVRDLEAEDNIPVREVSSYDFLQLRMTIVASSTTVARFENRKECAIADTMLTNQRMDAVGTTRSVKALAKALSKNDPATFGLLRCCGVINKSTQYEFVFEISEGLSSTPRSLRDLLANYQPSLNTKLEIAKQLSNAVFHLHAIGFVHKNIRPESTLIFDRTDDKATFVFGFEDYRMAKDKTFFTSDERPERELYRHPSRQGSNIQRRYVMQHDIYSLGICLLEIGLWRSFVKTSQQPEVYNFGVNMTIQDPVKKANAVKKKLLAIVDEQLPQSVGTKYKNVVERCLTWLDKEEIGTDGAPKVDVGLQFIDDVLQPLKEILV